jgi:hypothetical protein
MMAPFVRLIYKQNNQELHQYATAAILAAADAILGY